MANLSDVLEWNVSPSIGSHPYSSSDTTGAKKRVMGITDWTATVRVMAQGAAPELTIGTEYPFVFTSAAGKNIWTGSGFLVSIDTGASPDDGGPVELTYNIEANGALAPSGAGSAPYSGKLGIVAYS